MQLLRKKAAAESKAQARAASSAKKSVNVNARRAAEAKLKAEAAAAKTAAMQREGPSRVIYQVTEVKLFVQIDRKRKVAIS